MTPLKRRRRPAMSETNPDATSYDSVREVYASAAEFARGSRPKSWVCRSKAVNITRHWTVVLDE